MIALFASLPSIITDQSLLGFISLATMIMAAMIQPLAASLWPSPIWSLVASVWPLEIRAAIFRAIAGISQRGLLIVGYVRPNRAMVPIRHHAERCARDMDHADEISIPKDRLGWRVGPPFASFSQAATARPGPRHANNSSVYRVN